MKLIGLQKELKENNYVVDINNIQHLSGILMYEGNGKSKGINIQVEHDRIRIFDVHFFGEPCTKKSWYDTITTAVFDNVIDFLNYIKDSE